MTTYELFSFFLSQPSLHNALENSHLSLRAIYLYNTWFDSHTPHYYSSSDSQSNHHSVDNTEIEPGNMEFRGNVWNFSLKHVRTLSPCIFKAHWPRSSTDSLSLPSLILTNTFARKMEILHILLIKDRCPWHFFGWELWRSFRSFVISASLSMHSWQLLENERR